MATKTRVPNKTAWALEDISAHCMSSREDWQRLMDMAERRMDPHMMRYLAQLRDRLAEIERIAGDARNGEYRQ
jgi:hypothetical protein